MKDLTEALLIEMERRADQLVAGLGDYPSEMLRNELEDTNKAAYKAAQAVAKDVEELCAQIRAKVTA